MTTRASSLPFLALLACGGGSTPPPAQPAPAQPPAATAPAAPAPAAQPAPAAADPRTDAEREFDQMADEVCACADKPCYHEAVTRWAKRNEGKKGDPSARPSDRMKATAERFGQCVKRIHGDGDPEVSQLEAERIAELELLQMKDDVCGCRYKDCYDEVMARWAAKAQTSKSPRLARPTQRMKEIAEELGKCVYRIMDDSMPAPPDDGGN